MTSSSYLSITEPAHPWTIAIASLQLANRLIDSIQDGVRAAGFADVRPVHGFAFVRLASGDATTATLASYLGVTKQAAAQLVERMVRDGFVERLAHPADHRARLLRLTPRARAVTRVAQAAAEQAVSAWRAELDPPDRAAFEQALLTLTAASHTVRPTW
jgi:DNA-binding MarR family transcriptional regulator